MKLVNPKKLWNAFLTAKAIGGVLVSFVLGAAAVVGGFYIAMRIPSGKLFSIPVTSIGCFLSGAFFAWQLKKVIEVSKVVGVIDNETHANLEDQNKTLSGEIAELKTAYASLKHENDQLKRQRISINSFTPIFQAALIEADMEIKDVKTDWKKVPFKSKSYFGKPTCEQYIGVLQDEFKAKYGVDFNSIRIWIDRNTGKVKVDGVKACHVGDIRKSRKWLVCERQTFHMRKGDAPVDGVPEDTADGFCAEGYWYSKDPLGGVSTTIDENELKEDKAAQIDVLSKRIESCECKELQLVSRYAVQMGKELIKFVIGPYVGDRQIEFVDSIQDGVSPLTLENFVKQREGDKEGCLPLLESANSL